MDTFQLSIENKLFFKKYTGKTPMFSKLYIPQRETFMHLFLDCPYINHTVCDFAALMMRNEIDPVKNKVGILTGTYDTVGGGDAIFLNSDIDFSELLHLAG